MYGCLPEPGHYTCSACAPDSKLIVYIHYRFAFQVVGTLMVFIILWILLAELPEPGNTSFANHTLIAEASCSSDNSLPLNSGESKAFWVSLHHSKGL